MERLLLGCHLEFEPIGLGTACLVRLPVHRDDRGVFSRSWCLDSFRSAGIDFFPVQANYSVTPARATIRGMHFQAFPKPDPKLVRCTRGRVFEVVVDVRMGSPTWGRWYGQQLADDSFSAMYVPPGFAQGFQSLSDDVVVEYLMGERFDPALYSGFRYDDPAVGIRWPLPVGLISKQDVSWPALGATIAPAVIAADRLEMSHPDHPAAALEQRC